MPPIVVANSLSSITEVAEHPPLCLQGSTRPRRPSLVLYIARVPGSRDVILTPMKPRRKNVTAEDVTSSLYFLHLDLHSDKMMYQKPDEMKHMEAPMEPEKQSTAINLPHKGGQTTTKERPQSAMNRSPWKFGSSKVQWKHTLAPFKAPVRTPPLPLRSSPLHSPASTPQASLSSYQAFLPSTPLSSMPDTATPIARLSLGPRPIVSQTHINRKSLPSGDITPTRSNGTESVPPKPSSFYPSANGPRGNSTVSDFECNRDNTVSISEMSPIGEAFSITLIRREPTSGAQWNVGKISSQPVLEASSLAVANSSRPQKGSSVWLYLTTPGYDQFQGKQTTYRSDESGVAVAQAESTLFQPGFYRQVHMEWSSFWDRSFKQHLRGSSDNSSFRNAMRARSSTDVTHGQLEDVDQGQSLSQDRGPKPRRCAFLSPWNGDCEFSTGAGGKSLKCKHTPPSNSLLSKQSSAAVSELRFNLPSAKRSYPPEAFPNAKQRVGHLTSAQLGHFRNKLSPNSSQFTVTSEFPRSSYAAMYPSDDDVESDEHLDLSLGQEKAGGGSRGERAKLGKLIIHDEGFKMLDLVVAANMSIWWTVWEKRSVLPTTLPRPI